eukprot:TRINITY_DN2853_c0_g1_i2.p1 TRINITY_DN2853_c0_g1~~TRINITY_DN2853_c0_g1_i2.p1  ORF type:complete len:381 (+),score=69.76 TRINITY_DN2853_c0_g1_i2:72-1145(+)
MTFSQHLPMQNQKKMIVSSLMTFLLFTLVVFAYVIFDPSSYLNTKDVATDQKFSKFTFGIVADQDEDSYREELKAWASEYLKGTLTVKNNTWSVNFDEDYVLLTTKTNEKGRGMELSELINWNGKLYTCDDRTGIIFEIIDNKAYRRFVTNAGDGNNEKGFKCEWLAVKDNHLYVGSIGKYWTFPNNDTIINDGPLWIKTISPSGEIKSFNWTMEYNLLREATGTTGTGYLIHEAGIWHEPHKKWYFLPRRVSTERYNDVDDERRGSNVIIEVDETFSNAKAFKIGDLDNTRGFSTAKFIPGYPDILMAVKSYEVDNVTRSYFVLFDVKTKKVLIPETLIKDGLKFEGIEIVKAEAE